jgi:hypothetical protein
LETDGYDTPTVAREAVEWLRRHGDQRFLLYVHFSGAHAPYRAPLTDIVSSYPGSGAFRSYADSLLWLYQSKVAYSDRYVGKVLDELKRLGLDQHTTVVLTADHGDQLTLHRYLGNTAAPDFTGAYFDHGATLLNDEIHVPFVVKRPGLAPRQVESMVSTLDLGPTLFDLSHLGNDAAHGCAGASLAPYLAGEKPESLQHRVLSAEGFHGRTIVIDGRWKYIRSYEATDKRVYDFASWGGGVQTLYLAPEQLFDLAVDTQEERDVKDERPDILAKARQLYRETYAIKDAYELVVESPKNSPFTAVVPAGTRASFEIGEGEVSDRPDGVHISGGGRSRYLIELNGPLAAAPVVTIAGRAQTVAATSMRLPLTVPPEALSEETSGRYTLFEPALADVAYVRRVADDGQKNRRLLTGNPAFEKVLREWGYLNDK